VEESVDERHPGKAFIHAYHPRHTYYRGLFSNSDVQPHDLPMKPEISVVSTVRLYFKSPASEDVKKKEASETQGGHRRGA
jgi:hypothetical protein